MDVIKDIRNELFKRQEITIKLESDKNLSFDEAKKKVAEQFSKPEENIEVYNILGNFGSKIFNISGYVYDSKEDLEKAVQKTKKQRKEGRRVADEKRGEEAKAAAAPKEEKPTEEVVEAETPVEEEAEEAESPSEPKEAVEKSSEVPVEEEAEEAVKEAKEEKQGEEEAKEN